MQSKTCELICVCHGIPREVVLRCIQSQVAQNQEPTVEDIGLRTTAGLSCTACHEDIQKMIDFYHENLS